MELLVSIGVLAIIIVVVWWLLQQMNLPEPIQKIVTIVLVIVVAVVLIGLLLSLTGHGGFSLRLK